MQYKYICTCNRGLDTQLVNLNILISVIAPMYTEINEISKYASYL